MIVAISCALAMALTVRSGEVEHAPDSAWAQQRQAELAADLLGDNGVRRERAVFVADALGPSRMSEDVRIALITLLEQFNDEQDVAEAQGIALESVVQGEFFLWVARVVATLDDPRAISALARVGNHAFSKHVASGLARLGEQALPAIVTVIDASRAGESKFAVRTNLLAISMMVGDGGADRLSASAREDIVRVTRDSFWSQRGTTIRKAIDIAVALDEPELVQMVVAISQDPSIVAERGLDGFMVDRVHKHAVDALSVMAE